VLQQIRAFPGIVGSPFFIGRKIYAREEVFQAIPCLTQSRKVAKERKEVEEGKGGGVFALKKKIIANNVNSQ